MQQRFENIHNQNTGFNDYYISADLFFTLFCLYCVAARPSSVRWLSGGVDLWKYSPLQMNTLLFHWQSLPLQRDARRNGQRQS